MRAFENREIGSVSKLDLRGSMLIWISWIRIQKLLLGKPGLNHLKMLLSQKVNFKLKKFNFRVIAKPDQDQNPDSINGTRIRIRHRVITYFQPISIKTSLNHLQYSCFLGLPCCSDYVTLVLKRRPQLWIPNLFQISLFLHISAGSCYLSESGTHWTKPNQK